MENQPKRKPLIIQGARQIGKTWAMKHFGEQHFAKVAYINFDNNLRMKRLFAGDYDINRLLLDLKIESGLDIQAEYTLLIFEEIQEVPQALSSLKYFYENVPQFYIVAAGSAGRVAASSGFVSCRQSRFSAVVPDEFSGIFNRAGQIGFGATAGNAGLDVDCRHENCLH